jgi:hypothetical protein
MGGKRGSGRLEALSDGVWSEREPTPLRPAKSA